MSLRDIWQIIMRKKIVFYVVFVSISLVILFLIIFVFNPLRVTYSLRFQYHWYGLENNTYANGMPFNYFDLIAQSNLEKVKNQKERYHKINIDNLADSIEIIKENDDYVLKVTGVFKDHTTARDFMLDLISIPYQTALTMSFEFNTNIIGYEGAKKIDTKLDYLEKHIQLLKTGYSGLIHYFGNVSYDNTSLQDNLDNLEIYDLNHPISMYRNLAYKNTYMTKEEYQTLQYEQQALEAEKSKLEQRKTILVASIESIYQSSSMDFALTDYMNSLHSIDIRLIEIEENLMIIKQAHAGEYQEDKSELFIQELDQYKNDLKEFSDRYSVAVTRTLQQNTFMNIKEFRTSGRLNALMTSILSILIGLSSALAVAFLVGYFQSNDNK